MLDIISVQIGTLRNTSSMPTGLHYGHCIIYFNACNLYIILFVSYNAPFPILIFYNVIIASIIEGFNSLKNERLEIIKPVDHYYFKISRNYFFIRITAIIKASLHYLFLGLHLHSIDCNHPKFYFCKKKLHCHFLLSQQYIPDDLLIILILIHTNSSPTGALYKDKFKLIQSL